MRWGHLTREWRQRSGNVSKGGFLGITFSRCIWSSRWCIMKMCALPRRTFTEKGYDLEFRRLSFFLEKTLFLKFSQKKYSTVDFSSDWWGREKSHIASWPEQQCVLRYFLIFHYSIISIRYKIKSAKHILENLLLWSFEIGEKVYILRIS